MATTIVTLRRNASSVATAMKENVKVPMIPHWIKHVATPIEGFATELRAALHEGVVGNNEDFWQQVINKVIESNVSNQVFIRRIAGQPTLFAQVKELVDEVSVFPTAPFSAAYNRYQVVLTFCEALKTVRSHH